MQRACQWLLNTTINYLASIAKDVMRVLSHSAAGTVRAGLIQVTLDVTRA